MVLAELKFSPEKWCKSEFDIAQNDEKWAITIYIYI